MFGKARTWSYKAERVSEFNSLAYCRYVNANSDRFNKIIEEHNSKYTRHQIHLVCIHLYILSVNYNMSADDIRLTFDTYKSQNKILEMINALESAMKHNPVLRNHIITLLGMYKNRK